MTLAWLLPLVPRYTNDTGKRMWTMWFGVSVTTAAVLAWSTNQVGAGVWTSIGFGVAVVPLGALFTIDSYVHRLPRQIAFTTTIPLFILLMIESGPGGRGAVVVSAAVNTAIAWGLRAATRGSLGPGDVMVAPILGSIVGWFDPWSLATLWLSASVLGAVWSIGLVVSGRRSKSDHIAYGPFLIVGTLVAVWGSVI